jgi:hypothetical protein
MEHMKKIRNLVSLIAICLLWNISPVNAANINISSWLVPSTSDKSETLYQSYNQADRNQFRIVNGLNAMEIKFDGDISVSDNDRSIRSISPGGYLSFSIRTFGNKRELTISSDRTGRLSYEYFEGRTEVPFEPEGRKWMEDILIDVVRSSGIDAVGRSNRIYLAKGLSGFLDEMLNISSNSVKSLYYSALLSEHSLPNKELQALAESITRTISSNTERGRLYRKYSDIFLEDSDVAVSYFSAVSRLSSNSERGRIYRNVDNKLDFSDRTLVDAYFQGIDKMISDAETGSVLRHTLKNQDLTPQAQVHLFHSVARMTSSTEAGLVIRSTGDLDLENRDVAEACFAAIDRIASETETGSALRHILANNEIKGPTMEYYLNSCRRISSSTEKSRALRSIKEIDLAGNDAVKEQYFNAISTLSSTTESGRVLRYTLENHSLDKGSMVSLYESTARLSSSTERSSVLRASIPHLIYEQTVLDAFFRTVSTTSSPTEQGRVLRALIEKGESNKIVSIGTLNTARRISSNTEKGSVLRAIAPKIPKEDTELKELYMEAVKTLSSNTEYRRAVDAML